LKSLASGNSITVKALYEAPVTMVNTATLIFTANNPPSFKDKGFGLTRRLKVVPFEANIEKREFGFLDRLSTQNAKEYLLRVGLEGVQRIFANNLEISEAECINQATAKYHVENDSVLSWEQENPINITTEIQKVYTDYAEWCRSCGLKAVNIKHFSRRLRKLGYITKREWSSYYGKPVTFIIPTDKHTDKTLTLAYSSVSTDNYGQAKN
jgi:putative DNA primase/helicase